MKKILNYINGGLHEPMQRKYLETVNPALGDVYAQVPDSDEEDVSEAVTAASAAFPMWSALPAEKRCETMRALADLVEKNAAMLADAESIDNGKPIALAEKIDIPRTVKNLRFFAGAGIHYSSRCHEMTEGAINYTLRQPLGVVGCISPWNLPLYLFTWKTAPALAAGNCVVAKPSELTPMTAYLLSELCIAAGFPPGVLNIVHGSGPGAGEAIVRASEVKAISFTGGTATGARIASITAPLFKKLSLELGGKNPSIIFADCDYEAMMQATVMSSFSNQGQICLCGSRIFVEASLYERFKADFTAATKALKIGDPALRDTQVGAVVSQAHMNKILGYIDLARQEGGKILCGGARAKVPGRCEGGFFVEPTIIEGLSYQCRTNQEEIFGPVVTIMPFKDEAEVEIMANSTDYGLSATIWTGAVSRAHRLASRIDAGVVWVNTWMLRDLRTPFGGMKHSGMGREGGFNALDFFTEAKNVCIKYS